MEPRAWRWQRHRGVNDNLPLTAPVLVMLPLESTWTSGPVQVQSKYVLTTMFAAEGVKNRLLRGARSVVVAEERTEASRRVEDLRWGMAGYLCRRL